MDQSRPALQRLADALLPSGESLDEFVASRRRAGRSWRLLTRDLYEATDQQIDVTPQTLQNWYPLEERTGWRQVENQVGAA